jgi:hypothetical protein
MQGGTLIARFLYWSVRDSRQALRRPLGIILMAKPIDSFEISLNENTADLQVFRITLTTLILRLVGQNPATALEGVQDLKSSVMGAIGRIQTDPLEDGSDRMKQMTSMRADKFFLELEVVVSEAQKRMGIQVAEQNRSYSES